MPSAGRDHLGRALSPNEQAAENAAQATKRLKGMAKKMSGAQVAENAEVILQFFESGNHMYQHGAPVRKLAVLALGKMEPQPLAELAPTLIKWMEDSDDGVTYTFCAARLGANQCGTGALCRVRAVLANARLIWIATDLRPPPRRTWVCMAFPTHACLQDMPELE